MPTQQDNRPLRKLWQRHYEPARTLLVGSKAYPDSDNRLDWYDDVLGVDIEDGDGVGLVWDIHNPLPDVGRFDHLDICSVIEHLKRPWIACENVTSVLNDGATVLLSVPFVWRVHNYPGDYWRVSKGGIKQLFPTVKWTELEYYANGKVVKRPFGITHGGKKYMERTELIGWGVHESP